MKKALYIPPNKKTTGMVVYCLKCKTNMYEICKETGNALKSCSFGDKHRFKVYLQLPGTTKRVTKTFETRNLNEAIKEAQDFKKSLMVATDANVPVLSKPIETKQTETSEIFNGNLVALMAKYLTFISGDESVPLHLRRSRSKPYLGEIEKCFKNSLDCFQREVNDVSSIDAAEVDKNMVGKFFQYIKEEKGLSNRTVNKQISFMRTFYNWLRKHEGLQIINPFELVVKLPEYHNPLAITNEEFQKLLNVTTPENGILKDGGVKEWRNMFRPWLKYAFKLSLLTGRRREEIINFKWSDIVNDKQGNPILIASEDRKVNAIQNRTEQGQKKINFVPISTQLYELLLELGHDKFKDTNNFILAPKVKMQRGKSMVDVISRGFSHFFKQTNPERELKFKSIRKRYLTDLQIFTGNAKAISGHSGNAVLEQHYLDKAEIAKSLRNFSVFGNQQQERLSELSAMREKQNRQEISLEK